MRDDTLILGLVGSFGSGCGTAARHFNKRHTFAEFSLAKFVREYAETKYSVQNPRRNQLQDLGDELRFANCTSRTTGKKQKLYAHLARSVDREMRYHTKTIAAAQDFVIRGIRHPDEIAFFRNRYGRRFVVINVDAPADRRWEYVHREEGYITRAEFDENDRRDSGEDEPDWGQHVQQCCDEADIVVLNTTSKEELHQKLDYYLNLIRSPGSQPPTQHELAMRHAYTARSKSTCTCRKVGAAILVNDSVVSTGHNGKREMQNSCKQLNRCPRKTMTKCTSCGSPIQFTLERCMTCNELIDPNDFKALGKKLDFCIGIHAEERAILNTLSRGQPPKTATLCSTTFPCLLCAKVIVEAGIRALIYTEPYPYRLSREILMQSKVRINRFEGVTANVFDRLYNNEKV